jgi:hypothetical protein
VARLAELLFELADPALARGDRVLALAPRSGERVGEPLEPPLGEPQLLRVVPIAAAHEVGQHVDLAEGV